MARSFAQIHARLSETHPLLSPRTTQENLAAGLMYVLGCTTLCSATINSSADVGVCEGWKVLETCILTSVGLLFVTKLLLCIKRELLRVRRVRDRIAAESVCCCVGMTKNLGMAQSILSSSCLGACWGSAVLAGRMVLVATFP